MPGSEGINEFAVVLAARVLIANEQHDGRAGRAPLEDARKYLDPVRLLTLRDVAVAAGVTAITVSRCLRSPGQVAPETAARLQAAIAATGYVPNKQAGLLAGARSSIVAALVPNLAHSIFAETIQGLSDALGAAGLELLVASSGYSAEREEAQRRVELLHRAWTKDREYIPAPTTGRLASIDAALVVAPPKGLEIGHVPIAIRQERSAAPARSRREGGAAWLMHHSSYRISANHLVRCAQPTTYRWTFVQARFMLSSAPMVRVNPPSSTSSPGCSSPTAAPSPFWAETSRTLWHRIKQHLDFA